MPLEISTGKAIYDEERDTVVFMGMDGAKMVRCSITHDALTAMGQRRARSAKEMLDLYRSNATRINWIARTKYGQRKLDLDGSILVVQRDIYGSHES